MSLVLSLKAASTAARGTDQSFGSSCTVLITAFATVAAGAYRSYCMGHAVSSHHLITMAHLAYLPETPKRCHPPTSLSTTVWISVHLAEHSVARAAQHECSA